MATNFDLQPARLQRFLLASLLLYALAAPAQEPVGRIGNRSAAEHKMDSALIDLTRAAGSGQLVDDLSGNQLVDKEGGSMTKIEDKGMTQGDGLAKPGVIAGQTLEE